MENAIVRTNEKIVWYSKEDKIMSFHFVVNYTKRYFSPPAICSALCSDLSMWALR